MTTLKAKVETVTPKRAQEILENNNTHNRRLTKSRVDRYARDMEAGRWKQNGASLVFNCDGTLLDGQHRLAAVVQSNRSVQLLVVRNADKDSLETIDDVRPRSVGDLLALRGETYSCALAAALRLLWRHRQGGITDTSHSPSNSERLALYDEEPQVRASLDLVAQDGEWWVGRVPMGFMAFFHYGASQVHPRKAREFVLALRDGAGLKKGTAVYELRRWFDLNTAQAAARRVKGMGVWYLVFRAWHHHLRGTAPKIQKQPQGGYQAGQFRFDRDASRVERM